MSRRIVTMEFQAGGTGPQLDGYFDKVLKYIPADINGAWVTATSVIDAASPGNPSPMVLWITFTAFVVVTALWTLRQTAQPDKAPARIQTLIATGAFIIWVMALGGPFTTLPGFRPVFASLLLIFYTLVVGLINPPEG